MNPIDLDELTAIVVRAKAATYAGDGAALLPYRLGSHDLQFLDGARACHDSFSEAPTSSAKRSYTAATSRHGAIRRAGLVLPAGRPARCRWD